MQVGISWDIGPVIFKYFKKHYCPDCGEKLKLKRMIKELSSHSEEWQRRQMSNDMAAGEVFIVWHDFICSQCNKRLTIDEVKEIEKTKEI